MERESNQPQAVSFEPIGVVHSCYRQKFGIPRQPGLVKEAEATLELYPPYNRSEALREIEGFSHIWLLFHFHAIPAGHWSPTVRPPRLGGNQRVGVFASRATHRPNPIGLSVVELLGVEQRGGGVALRIAGVDLLDGTPIFDIKPYVPYADAIACARPGFAGSPPARLMVSYQEGARRVIEEQQGRYPQLKELIHSTLSLDPRPGYRSGQGEGGRYGMRLYDFDIRWTHTSAGVVVEEIVLVTEQ